MADSAGAARIAAVPDLGGDGPRGRVADAAVGRHRRRTGRHPARRMARRRLEPGGRVGGRRGADDDRRPVCVCGARHRVDLHAGPTSWLADADRRRSRAVAADPVRVRGAAAARRPVRQARSICQAVVRDRPPVAGGGGWRGARSPHRRGARAAPYTGRGVRVAVERLRDRRIGNLLGAGVAWPPGIDRRRAGDRGANPGGTPCRVHRAGWPWRTGGGRADVGADDGCGCGDRDVARVDQAHARGAVQQPGACVVAAGGILARVPLLVLTRAAAPCSIAAPPLRRARRFAALLKAQIAAAQQDLVRDRTPQHIAGGMLDRRAVPVERRQQVTRIGRLGAEMVLERFRGDGAIDMPVIDLCGEPYGQIPAAELRRKLAHAVARRAGDRLDCHFVDIASLPLFSQDLEARVPEPVSKLKADIEAAQALWFFTPEYNRGMPGVLKNAIDWASRPYGKNSFAGKPAAVAGASIGTIGTAIAQQQLRNALAYLDVPTLGQPEVFLHVKDDTFDAGGNIANAGTKQFLQGFADRYVEWLDKLLQ
ncbi:hypothetical protein DFQ30_000144 [Apophysomyces sp. BC1015]|nr:hypothetical protein DFQ30_000144 [Apophysomyces sp. BC1015]